MALREALDAADRLAARAVVRRGLLVAALLGVYLQAHTFFLAESHEVDSYSYWFAASVVALGGNPYDLASLDAASRGMELRLVRSDARPPAIYPFVYPPPFAALWRLFLPLPPSCRSSPLLPFLPLPPSRPSCPSSPSRPSSPVLQCPRS